MTNHLMAGLSI